MCTKYYKERAERYEKFIKLILEHTAEDPLGGRAWHYEDIARIGDALLKGDSAPLDFWLAD